MWLIADSGSTKTEWVLFDEAGIKSQVSTAGLNPLFLTSQDFAQTLNFSRLADWKVDIEKVWFYSAGCGSEHVKNQTKSWIEKIFSKAEIVVNSDLLAAARAACGSEEGIIAILGTGANSCLYDGKNIKDHIKPLGFILGDEGSGAALGKSLLKKLLRKQLNSELSAAIFTELGVEYEEIINLVYKSAWPNRYLASCSKVLYKYKSEPAIKEIIESEFNLFSSLLKMYNSNLKVNVVGSIGFYFKDYVQKSLIENGLQTGVFLQSPTENLVNFHLKNN